MNVKKYALFFSLLQPSPHVPYHLFMEKWKEITHSERILLIHLYPIAGARKWIFFFFADFLMKVS